MSDDDTVVRESQDLDGLFRAVKLYFQSDTCRAPSEEDWSVDAETYTDMSKVEQAMDGAWRALEKWSNLRGNLRSGIDSEKYEQHLAKMNSYLARIGNRLAEGDAHLSSLSPSTDNVKEIVRILRDYLESQKAKLQSLSVALNQTTPTNSNPSGRYRPKRRDKYDDDDDAGPSRLSKSYYSPQSHAGSSRLQRSYH